MIYIKDAINSSYIDSILISLFYNENNNNYNANLSKSEYFYLQEIIKNKFINKIKNNKSITDDVIHEIRTVSYFSGWMTDKNMFMLHNAKDYYEFVLNVFNLEFIMCKTKDNIIKLPYISLDTTQYDSSKELNIKTLLNDYIINNNIKIINTPNNIALHINRINNNNQKICNDIDIQQYIYPFSDNDDNYCSYYHVVWQIDSIVCFDIKYYTVVKTNTSQWIKIQSDNIPSIEFINIKNSDIVQKIKRDAYLVVYKLVKYNNY